jgi:hypothetical protein
VSLGRLSSGAVIRYQFLWAPEAARGETEGRKPRPAVVGFRLDGGVLLLFPITTKAPAAGRFFKEVPETEKRRAGLDPASRSWIILDEINTDDVASSRYLEPDCEIGRFSRAFTLHVFREWVNERRARTIAVTSRR